MSQYTFRIVSNPATTLVKELKLLGFKKAKVVPGRKIVETNGTLKDLYKIIYHSRIAEDVQLRVTKPFLARGDKEFTKNLHKIPWHAFMPLDDFLKYKFPLVTAKSFQSNLYHTRKITDLVQIHINDLPIRKEYNKVNRAIGFKRFKKEYKDKLRKENRNIIDFRDNFPKKAQADSIDFYRTKIEMNIKRNEELMKLSKINVILHKNKAEVLLDTVYDSLYKHGYRALEAEQNENQLEPIRRNRIVPGVIRETLAAASILESGIIERANNTGKLYVWDPFCGTGTFLIELLQMFRGDPLKRESMQFCFEHWPIFKADEFEETKSEIFKTLENYELDPKVDIRIIGSDIKMIKDYIYNSGIPFYRHNPSFSPTCSFKDNPLLPSYHFPPLHRHHQDQLPSPTSPSTTLTSSQPGSLTTQAPPFFSFYKGDFEAVAHQIHSTYGSFKDFSIITNVPYGKQILHPKQAKNLDKKMAKGIIDQKKRGYQYTGIQDVFRRFGHLCNQIAPEMNNEIYVVARKMRYSNPLAFTRLSNCGWKSQLDFVNGGINVNLLKYDQSKLSKNRELLKIYSE
ncbi:unnamed protein product [Moneuplotes crassus]|uniref:Ribosomal RNA large subunit methyltransferase K/L-like methyltransferase domain-containing protein n=1 Tax=Euplotes crassus TaxID=5936 RepID=A0AAD1UAW5_EUPCR|nr:unnamed protein product [Moneuplotes crassus]